MERAHQKAPRHAVRVFSPRRRRAHRSRQGRFRRGQPWPLERGESTDHRRLQPASNQTSAKQESLSLFARFRRLLLRLAKEYASQYDPEGLVFDYQVLDQFVKSALKLYTEVAQVDGTVEKIEAQGKIEATRGFLEKMTRLNR